MGKVSEIFSIHYQDYCGQIGLCDLRQAAEILGMDMAEGKARVRFLNRTYLISGAGVEDEAGQRPAYGLCVILAKYVLRCPERIYHEPQWVAFRDFKKEAAVTNVNFFTSDTEAAMVGHFQGRAGDLAAAGEMLGGVFHDTGAAYDVSLVFDLLPRIRLLLLYNGADEDFPALCRVLFEKHAEIYLDPESLAMAGAALTRALVQADPYKG